MRNMNLSKRNSTIIDNFEINIAQVRGDDIEGVLFALIIQPADARRIVLVMDRDVATETSARLIANLAEGA